jgi:CRISPR-associated endonuclease/helicase Cas3
MDYNQFFSSSFLKANDPFPYQSRLAGASLEPTASSCESRLIVVPTGLGKTAAVVLAWLWNRVHRQSDAWPRRLVYCLPMRTLAEQTFQNTEEWLKTHQLLWDGQVDSHEGKVGLHLLMGGESAAKWEQHPEENCILIGTQDMLLSRALNRGYGMSRFRWPMHYGLLNNDCLWVFDEVQLMGAGLPTTAQLAAFRDSFGTAKPSHTWWMSATNKPDWLKTVDFDPFALAAPVELEDESDLKSTAVIQLREARKTVEFCKQSTAEPVKLAAEILDEIKERAGLTLVVVNTVRKAKDLHVAMTKQLARSPEIAAPILLHSQFRSADRANKLSALLASENKRVIAISTQIIEAGVDISAATLFTEMAPWSSLVQRFGRCNRRGTEDDAKIFLMNADKPLPYEAEQLTEAKRLIDGLIADGADASPAQLGQISIPDCDKPVSKHVIRKRDFIDLFDTTPDLAGQDIDIERWVRETDDSKVSLFWRTWESSDKDQSPPPENEFPAPHRNELCPAPIGEAKDWAGKAKFSLRRWDHLTSNWQKVPQEYGKLVLIPGQIYLVPSEYGGYSTEVGFDPKASSPVTPIISNIQTQDDSTQRDQLSEGSWQSIAIHSDHVANELHIIMEEIEIVLAALPHAARWHDLGKAHPAFKAKFKPEQISGPEGETHSPLAKAPHAAWMHSKAKNLNPEFRSLFRHELASALAVLHPEVCAIPEDCRDLVAWLIAVHHGKIRLSIRSLPGETPPADLGKRFARGVWDGDPIESVFLGAGVTSPALNLSLEPMEIGLCQEPPFEGQPSWSERMLKLRDAPEIGPLRLAFWETLLRAADERASAKHP